MKVEKILSFSIFHRFSIKSDTILYKIIKSFSFDFFAVIKFYLLHRTFIVKYEGIVTQLNEINSGIPRIPPSPK